MVHSVAHGTTVHGYGVIFGSFAAGIIRVPVSNDLLLAYLGHLLTRFFPRHDLNNLSCFALIFYRLSVYNNPSGIFAVPAGEHRGAWA